MNSDEKETKISNESILRPSIESEPAEDELERCFDDILSRIWPSFLDWAATEEPDSEFPAVDIVDRNHEIEVRAALPGVDIADLYVSISNQAITIRGSLQQEYTAHDHPLTPDRPGGDFKRTVPLPDYVVFLPDQVSNERVTASFKEGILTVVLPKNKKCKPKSLEISE
jgi:HSP20 family protein